MPSRSTLTCKGRQTLSGHRIAIRPKPFSKEPPPAPIPFEFAYMSSWEWQLYQALKKRGISFTTQVSYAGGAGVLGGMRVDFVLLDRPVVLRVQGPWHNFPNARSRDELQRLYLQGQGYTVIDFFEEDLEDLDRALQNKLGVPVRMG